MKMTYGSLGGYYEHQSNAVTGDLNNQLRSFLEELL